ncbi:aminotransferase class V-fold PLP-dependent enzyme [Kineococcus sp. T13]|uniref:kynureninase n=1 Tax=Kineococcus vitellinus TaxID=2696565 RepID=UPI00196A7AF1|nr:aminotransferase class V-fold PLP-dependent enzyme [Kineococcus vitellinus]NAZ75336.1 aminotransferase class V-fold PLP-dependent enzyme [Kineococcus vitellinus]
MPDTAAPDREDATRDAVAALRRRADRLDAEDPLAALRAEFLLEAAPGVGSYLDGNSLGRPLKATAGAVEAFVREQWGGQLIRGWTAGPASAAGADATAALAGSGAAAGGWMDWPQQLGDLIGRAALGAAPGQTVVADSTTVLFYKLVRAAVDAAAATGRDGDGAVVRDEIVCDTDNFPTDRFVLEGVAAERGLRLRWIETDPAAGITPEQVAAALGPRTALATFSHVAYRSGHLADAEAITRAVHQAGALVLWDLSHSTGSVELALDAWGVDMAVGCTYKYLNGGPGAPAFAYLAARHHGVLRQPVQGWMGHADPFAMGAGYQPGPGVRQLVSGTPPILGMVPVRVGAEQLERVGIAAVRAKSLRLTSFALQLADELLVPLGVQVATPREPQRRGGHLTLREGTSGADFRAVTEQLWRQGVLPDFRAPDGVRIGLAPLSTGFGEVLDGLLALRALLAGSAR